MPLCEEWWTGDEAWMRASAKQGLQPVTRVILAERESSNDEAGS
ncbi:MAG: hypothetical protein ACE5K0_04655 [Candidatus Methanofastidiosia archaeon]